MFKVLDENGKKITVATIDVSKHKHVSWRSFTKEDWFDKIIKVVKKKTEDTKPLFAKKK